MTSKDFEIKSVEPTILHIPFHARCAKVKEVRVPFWSIVDVVEVTLACGVKGIGETLSRYTWGQSDETQFNRVRGKNLFDHLWDDSLGAGLQMALFGRSGKSVRSSLSQTYGRAASRFLPGIVVVPGPDAGGMGVGGQGR